ncbi:MULTISPECIES: FG-GAP-like repeat-containing protein [unclassified Streptomyces]|uniref:FG-GAP-like repeat-containing protein n=1 Tax=unclassified Streptomyces TaxID=2593676 RepID=UPI0016605C36|nr:MULTISPECIES: FG-GAP-like repeat-containing protein [unclassified Streptomyces]MBD0709070.1 hypothetical protein [Streptomyces sp. CBMA291]MBD0716220.1 hypothetical protein [Streptomyces sp. CBMA370]
MATALVLGLAATGLSLTHASAAETVYPTFAAAFDNAGIATEADPGAADLDGAGNSLSANTLDAAGWTQGARVTIAGTTYTRPAVAPGQPDNIVADGQRVPVTGSGNALGFLLTATGGAVSGSGTVHYVDGTSLPYELKDVGDWKDAGKKVSAALVLGRSARETAPVQLFAVTVPLAAGKAVSSVTLPAASGAKRLHVFSMAVRSTPAAPNGASWTGSWSTAYTDARSTAMGAAETLPAYPDWSNQTMRMVVNPHTGGSTIRLRFANTFSPEPVKLGHVTVARQSAGAAAVATPVTATFGGSQQATLPAGGEIVSDPLPLSVTAGGNLLVSYHLPGTVKVAPHHAYALTTSYTTARLAGDQSAVAAGAGFVKKLFFWSLVSGVDVATPGTPGTVVALGDSQTDGAHSESDLNRRWPDYYAAFLNAKPGAPGVLNAGINGNRLTKDVDGGAGPSALTRLDRDVFAQPNVREVVLYEGVNDLLFENPSAATVMKTIRSIATEARARGIRVTVATIPGFSGYTVKPFVPFRVLDSLRQEVNEEIRAAAKPGANGAPALIDDVVDFDLATKDLDDPYAIKPSLASVDKLHFTSAGTELLARTLADRTVLTPLAMGETTAADFDGDGASDLIARHDATGTLKMWRGRANGTFEPPVDVPGDWRYHSQIVAADFDGDGKADILASYEGPLTGEGSVNQKSLRLWKNKGDGTFFAPTHVTGGWNFTQTAAADFDRDGKADLIARDADGNLKIWAGRGNGTFEAPRQVTDGWNYTQTVAADFNGDGKADIIARDPATGKLKLWLHGPNGDFDLPVDVTGGWLFSQTTAAADIDGDGMADLLARDDADGRLRAWSGKGTGKFAAPRDVTLGW